MREERYTTQLGGHVDVDVCHHCNGLWFDGIESHQLGRASMQALVESMRARQDTARAPWKPARRCPRCDDALKPTFDRQGHTRFHYDRCGPHGRFISFAEWLREKRIARTPTPKELQVLAGRFPTVRCSSCASKVDLATGSTCATCGTEVTVLGGDAMDETLKAAFPPKAAAVIVGGAAAAGRPPSDQGSNAADLVELAGDVGGVALDVAETAFDVVDLLDLGLSVISFFSH